MGMSFLDISMNTRYPLQVWKRLCMSVRISLRTALLLVKSLEEQYSGLPLHTPVVKNISSLSANNTFTITTAHQPAIFTGSLYFIYKILHVIKLAEVLSQRFPDKHFVPVFYMGSEDADLDELGNIYLDNEKMVWDTSQTGAVGRMHTEGLEKIIDRIEGEFTSHSFWAGINSSAEGLLSPFGEYSAGNIKIIASSFRLVWIDCIDSRQPVAQVRYAGSLQG